MKVVLATSLVLALFGWGEASKVKSLVYEDYGGSILCYQCSTYSHCPRCMTYDYGVVCKHPERIFKDKVKHSIKDISVKRKKGFENIWLVTVKADCPPRGEVSGVFEWSYRNGKVEFIRSVPNEP